LLYNHFPKDEYNTGEDTPRFLSDKLLFNTRLTFVAKFVKVLFRARKTANSEQYDTAEWIKSSIDILKIIEGCGGRFNIKGLDNIHNDNEPVVFISNHMSTLETMIFPSIIAPTRPVTFVVKDSLITHPIFGPIMRARDPIVVSRKNSRDDLKTVLNRGKELLEKGISIIIFPQSTRSVEFKEKEFNSLGVKLASRSGVKIIPVAIKTNYWENGKIIKDIGPIVRNRKIHITFGKALNVSGAGKAEHQQVVDFIKDNLKKWQD
jgi:1-acyl-sn-glycerol-3-phosphate acyltransferase